MTPGRAVGALGFRQLPPWLTCMLPPPALPAGTRATSAQHSSWAVWTSTAHTSTRCVLMPAAAALLTHACMPARLPPFTPVPDLLSCHTTASFTALLMSQQDTMTQMRISRHTPEHTLRHTASRTTQHPSSSRPLTFPPPPPPTDLPPRLHRQPALRHYGLRVPQRHGCL
jgi:hypothetical protein